MSKQIVFLVALLLLSVACGKKSTIKSHVNAEKLACSYGDCQHIIHNVTFPLDNSMLAFENPLPGLGPIAGGIVKFVGDIFAKNTNMGRMEMQYVQPLPEIPEVVKSVRLKRFFFYMKPVSKKKTSLRRQFTDLISRYVLGKGHTTFKFLDKLAVRLSAVDVADEKNYVPTFMDKLDSKEAAESLDSIFKNWRPNQIVDTEVADDVILLKYLKKTKRQDTSNKNYGQIHYLETTANPKALRDYFASQPDLKPFLKRVLLFENSVLIELKKDPVSNVTFQSFMERHADEIDEKYQVNFIDTCNENSCLEINVPDVNLVPIALKGNSLKLESILEADNVPESFKLKGFVEFELKVESPI
jgi:hypothetical protein